MARSQSRSVHAEITVTKKEATNPINSKPRGRKGRSQPHVVGPGHGDPIHRGVGLHRRDISFFIAVSSSRNRGVEPRNWFRRHYGGIYHDDALALKLTSVIFLRVPSILIIGWLGAFCIGGIRARVRAVIRIR